MKRSSSFVFLSLFSASVACVPDLSVEAGLDIACAFNEDCPDAQLCHDRAARRYHYGYQSDGDEAEGARPVVVTLIDLQGNTSAILDAAALVLDFAPPALASPPLLSVDAVALGEEVTLQFVMSEPLPALPVVEMTGPGGTVAWDAQTVDDEFPLFFSYAFTRDAALDQGAYSVRIRATDAAGNEMDVNAGDITID